MKKLYRYYKNFHRSGELEGIFVQDDQVIQKSLGKTLYFYEVLGKHSEISIPLEGKDLTVLTDDQDFIEKFVKLKCSSGIYPLEYLQETDECENDECENPAYTGPTLSEILKNYRT